MKIGSFFVLFYLFHIINFAMDTNALLIEYSKQPPNKWILENATIRHRETNRVCADVVEVFLMIEDGKLIDFSFDGYMSIVATAVTSIVGEALVGMALLDILGLDEIYVKELIGDGISPRRRNASLMGILAVKNAIHKYLEDGVVEDFQNVQVD